MIKQFCILLFLLTIIICCSKQENADAIYKNGKIYTVNESQPWAEAVAIKDGKFIKVGNNADVEGLAGDNTEVVDLNGSFVMPGLIDMHTHPSMSMSFRVFCELPGTFYNPTEEMTIDALKRGIESYPDDQEWFFAEGYSSPVMSKGTLTKEFLDELIPDRPAYVKDESGHFGWANSKAFELLGIDKNTPDTPEGYYSRTEDGEPAGQIFEAAMNPFEEAIFPLSQEISELAKMKLLNEGSKQGITAMGDAYVFKRDLDDWQNLKREGKINMHLNLYMAGNIGTDVLTPVSEIKRYYEEYDLPGVPGVKMSMGGAVESRTESMLDNGYIDGSNPNPIIPAQKFAKYIKELDEAGIQIKVHAVGDGTVRATIDGFEPTILSRGENTLRHHIDHCSYVHPDDMKRLAELGIGASAWPMLGAPIGFVLNQSTLVTEQKFANYQPHRDLLDAGILMANHSDAPQANLWPWWGMEATITRGFPGEPDIEPLGMHQALTLEETIKVHTINGAWILHLEDVTGSIESGKWADMIILNHNLFEIPVTDVHKTEVQTTIFKGEKVYWVE